MGIPTKETDPIHNDAPEKTTFLLLDQPSGDANATGTPTTSKNEMAINPNKANWNAIVIILIISLVRYRLFVPSNPHPMELSLGSPRITLLTGRGWRPFSFCH